MASSSESHGTLREAASRLSQTGVKGYEAVRAARQQARDEFALLRTAMIQRAIVAATARASLSTKTGGGE